MKTDSVIHRIILNLVGKMDEIHYLKISMGCCVCV